MEYKVKEISYQEYKNFSKDFFYVYNRCEFLETLSNKAPKLHYLTVGGKKPRVILFIAEFDDRILAPYSAPFWSIEKIKKHLAIDSVDEIIKILTAYFEKFNKEIQLTLPPLFYDPDFYSQLLNCFLRYGFKIAYTDINHYLDIKSIEVDAYVDALASNARRNLRIAMDFNLEFIKAENQQDIKKAYDIIAENRKAKGYPLKLSFNQLHNTLNTIKGDVFLISKESKYIASAFVFDINKSNKQLIYWGDIPETYETKSMNFLAFKLVEYYKIKNIQFLDLGPSSDEGQPNFGLSNFKESIGASVILKPTLLKTI